MYISYIICIIEYIYTFVSLLLSLDNYVYYK